MVLVSFIVVFVWEAFAPWSHLLQHITHPLECIMEMTFLLLLCVYLLLLFLINLDVAFFFPSLMSFFVFFPPTDGREGGEESR